MAVLVVSGIKLGVIKAGDNTARRRGITTLGRDDNNERAICNTEDICNVLGMG